jgi:hypothetical protein
VFLQSTGLLSMVDAPDARGVFGKAQELRWQQAF